MMTTIPFQSNEDMRDLFNAEYLKTDVLATPRQRVRRTAKLIKAAALESISPCEVALVVEDERSCKRIRSRVVATGNEKVMLDNGLSIPIHSIHSVEFL